MIDEVTTIVESSDLPVLVLIVSGEKERDQNTTHTNLIQKIAEQPIQVKVLSFSVSENSIEFPKLLVPILYYFIPKNTSPVFFRTGTVLQTVVNDIQIVNKMTQGVSYEEARFTQEERESIAKVDLILEQEQETIHTFPSAFQQARNLAKEMWKMGKRAAQGLPVLVSTEEGFKRLSICESCEYLDKSIYRCSQCGCFMKSKTQLASASCPLNKWSAIV